ncbi:MAG: inositol monophosphatase [Lachnospiraceae bacterium]|nr:inositol monophosphatase [Lachnospiraceae bacterium]
MDLERLTRKIEDAVRHCGALMRGADRERAFVEQKEGHGNFVTFYDRQNQEYLKETLTGLLPGAVFVGEEEDVHGDILKGFSFVADPIDGTMNFIRDYRESAVSVALLQDAVPVIGVVYNPYLDEMFTAAAGMGARMNGKRIRVSGRPLRESVVLFGTSPYYEALTALSFRVAEAYCRNGLDIRRSGSAALDLCDIAMGRAEIFFEMRLSPWDYAAGSLIVREAGGQVTQADLSPLCFTAPCSVFARGSGIRDGERPAEILKTLGTA